MKNIIFCGVGGQGVILASRVLMETALEAGHDVKESEVHGMAQRGGSVNCNVRYGDKVYSPLIPKGKADYIVSFELLESVRMIPFLSEKGKIIVNKLRIDPVPVQNGAMKYPETLEEWITGSGADNDIVDTTQTLKEVGNKRAVNIVMLGKLSTNLDFAKESWLASIERLVRPEYVDLNKKAFLLGREL